ncbi:MAG TPA: SCO family protein, partial [Trebonia sp.]|nr:SCO family protein [Trebonia sp.]
MRYEHGVVTRGRSLLAAIFLACCALTMFAPAARADGDPGSDVLVYQNLFVTSFSGVSVSQQVELANLLGTAAHDGFPVRVAIIASSQDLGAITALWGKPAAYASFLGTELSLAYKQRLLVVMPDGFGFNWPGHPTASAYRVLAKVPIGTGGNGFTTATVTAVRTLAAASGVKLPMPTAAAGSAPAGTAGVASGGQPAPRPGVPVSKVARIALIVIAALAVADGLFRLVRYRRRWVPRLAALSRTLAARGKRALPPRLRRSVPATWMAASLVLAAAAGIVIHAVVGSPGGASAQTTLLADNPNLDPGTSLSGPAPGFTLTDQFGQQVSLRSYRGKVVMLAFNDSECTTICPMTTAALVDAK